MARATKPPESGTPRRRREWQATVRLGILATALAGFLASLSCASLTDLFRGPEASKEKQEEELLQSYGEAAWLSSQGRTLASLQALKKCVDRAPDVPFFRLHLADGYLDVNDADAAEKTLQPLVDQGYSSGELDRVQARIALQRKKYDDAIALFERSLGTQPGNLQALQALAVLYYEHSHNLEKTNEICDRILAIEGRNLHALLYHAQASALLGDVDETANLFARILHYQPQLIDRLDEIAQQLVQRGEKDKALELYRKGVLMKPSSDLLRRGFETLAGNGDTSATLEAYRSLAEEAAGNVAILDLYGEKLMEARQWDAAESQYRRILEIEPNNVAAYVATAEIAMQRGDAAEALKRFQEALDRNPSDPEVYAQVARIYVARGDLPKSEQLLRRALALGSNNATVMVLLSDVLEREGQLEPAEKYLKDALDAMPANPTILSLLAGFYMRHDRGAEAAEVLEQLSAVRPKDLAVYGQLIRFYLQKGRQRSLDLLIERGRKQFEDRPDFDILVGQVAAQEGDTARAEAALQRAMTAQPDNLDARILMASVYMTTNQGDKAIETLKAEQSLLRDPEKLHTWRLALAGTYMQLRRWPEAVEQFRKAQEENPEDFEAYPGLVESLIRSGKVDEGIEALNSAVRKFQVAKPKETQLLRAQIMLIQKEYQRAEGILATLAKQYPDDNDVQLSLGALYGETGKIEDAEAVYRKMIQREPDVAIPYNNLGYLLAEHGQRLDEAESLVKKALELQPGAGFILDSLGWVYYQKGDYDKALKCLEDARKRSAPDPEILEHLGDVLRKQGKDEAALSSYEAALRLEPDRETAKKKVGELKPKAGP